MILNVSGSIGYPFRSGFGSDNTHNPKYQKNRIHSVFMLGSDRFRFIFIGSGSVQIFGVGLFVHPSFCSFFHTIVQTYYYKLLLLIYLNKRTVYYLKFLNDSLCTVNNFISKY